MEPLPILEDQIKIIIDNLDRSCYPLKYTCKYFHKVYRNNRIDFVDNAIKECNMNQLQWAITYLEFKPSVRMLVIALETDNVEIINICYETFDKEIKLDEYPVDYYNTKSGDLELILFKGIAEYINNNLNSVKWLFEKKN